MANKLNSKFDPDQPNIYRIKIKGRLDDQWTEWFEGLTITPEAGGNTQLTGPVIDDAALHGLLKKVRDLGLPLISVNRIETVQADRCESTQTQKENDMRRPLMLWPLIFILLILATGGGLYGGITMLIDPTGDLLGVADALPLLPVSNFILPGIFLTVVMGLFPLTLIYGLLARPNWSWVDSFFNWSNYIWPWTATIALVVILTIWLAIEGFLMGFFAITYVTAVLGLLILLFALVPSVRKFYIR